MQLFLILHLLICVTMSSPILHEILMPRGEPDEPPPPPPRRPADVDDDADDPGDDGSLGGFNGRLGCDACPLLDEGSGILSRNT